MPVPAAHLYISTYVDAYTYTRLYSARKWRAGTYVYVRTFVRRYGQSSGTGERTDGRTGRTERQTDGQQICNALTLVLNEMRYGGRETVSGRLAGRGDDGPQGGAGDGGVGGWSAVGANSHLTNPIINN